MNITPDLVQRIADLSRLELGPDEAQKTAAELKQMLDYMNVLNHLDTTGVEPMSHVFPVKNVLREDVIVPSLDRDELLAEAPAADGGAFLVPRTVE